MSDPGAVEADRIRALELCPVSRETQERLGLLVQELRRWQRVKNLVGPATLDRVWTRHVADSLQLLDLAQDAKAWIDLGSGAGFPGLVIAIAASERIPGAVVHLVESNSRKCAFLRHVARLTGAAAVVHEGRIEDEVALLHLSGIRERSSFQATNQELSSIEGRNRVRASGSPARSHAGGGTGTLARHPALKDSGIEVVTARALAPLAQLLAWSYPLLTTGAIGLFPKGRDVDAELTEAAKSWTYAADLLPSRTDSEGRIVRLRSLQERP